MNTIMQHGMKSRRTCTCRRWWRPLDRHHVPDRSRSAAPTSGQVKTKAEPQADGSFKITGTKIFISAGEHDLAENIIHIVLARLPDAPAGHPRHLAVHRAEVPHQRRRLAGCAQHGDPAVPSSTRWASALPPPA
jgi:hypothetical protein